LSRRKLINKLKKRNLNLSNQQIENIINIFSESISNILKKGNNVEIRGLGRWYCKKLKKNFNARNPAKNELIFKPERIKVRFRASKNLKKIINE
jgi:nucleoid DNA-binding protein